MTDNSDISPDRAVWENRHGGMPSSLVAFEAALQVASAPCLARLRPPLPEGERHSLLQRFATQAHPVVPAELVDLYAWHDGVDGLPGAGGSLIVGSWRFLPLRGLVEYYEQTWLPRLEDMWEHVGSDIPDLARHRLYLPVFPSTSSDHALCVWPSRPGAGYRSTEGFSRLSTMGYGHGYHLDSGPMSLVALIELWTALLVTGAIRWGEDDQLFANGYGPLHWTTYRSARL